MAKKKATIVGGFVAIPHLMLNHQNFWSLSGYSSKLLMNIAAQYKGTNNGDLQAGWAYMKIRGWKSQDTLDKAKKELLAKGFIAETRKGAFPKTCSLYGITWQPLNNNSKLDVRSDGFPSGAWHKNTIFLTKSNDLLNTPSGQGKPSIDTPIVSMNTA
jgi:hypothetical protein